MVSKKPLPVTVLSGFLGAGKTTLLKRILTQTHEKGKNFKVALLVNDMAALNIDANLVRDTHLVQQEEKLIELHNGCICCTLREDLLEALAGFAAEGKYDAVVVEGTGVSDPLEVAETFTYELGGDPSVPQLLYHSMNGATTLNDVARLDTCVTVVDCATFYEGLSTSAELRDAFKGSAEEDDERSVGPLLMGQIEFADVLVLNKSDLVSKKQAKSIEAAIRQLNPGAEVVLTTRGEVPLEKVLCTNRFSMEKAQVAPGWLQTMRGEPVQPETEIYNISSFIYDARTPFHPERLALFMENHFTMRLVADEEDDEAKDPRGVDEDVEVGSADQPEDPEESSSSEEDVTDEEEDDFDQLDADERERLNKVKLDRTRAEFGIIMRSKGYLWIAGRDNLCGEWGHAGAVLEVSNGGPWMATLSEEYWPEEGTEVHAQVMADMQGEILRDRRQALVFIGQNLNREAVCKALDACLITKEEALSGSRSLKDNSGDLWKMGVTHLPDPFPHWAFEQPVED